METWPVYAFGWPSIQHSLSLVDPVIRTEMDRGFKARSRFLEPLYDYSYRILLTHDQLLHFRSWHREKINNGAAAFLMPFKTGDGVTYEIARFISNYTTAPADLNYVQVSFALETDATPVPDETALDAWLAAQ